MATQNVIMALYGNRDPAAAISKDIAKPHIGVEPAPLLQNTCSNLGSRAIRTLLHLSFVIGFLQTINMRSNALHPGFNLQ